MKKYFNILMSQNPDLSLKDHYGKTVLFDAIEGGSLNIVREIVNNIEDINIVDNNGQSGLFLFCFERRRFNYKVLIENGIKCKYFR